MSVRSALLFFAFISTLLVAACNNEPATPAARTDTGAPATIAKTGIIRLGIISHINSGMPTSVPSIVVVADGRVQAVRIDLEDVINALDAITKGEQILDEDDVRQDMQNALEKLLATQQMTPESLTAENKKVILLFSPDESVGECPPCTEAFGSLQANSTIGDFTIMKVLLENR